MDVAKEGTGIDVVGQAKVTVPRVAVSLLALATLAAVSAADARDITFDFTGVVTAVEISDNYPVSRLDDRYLFNVGDTFSGSYTFSTNTPDNDEPNENFSRFLNPVKIVTLVVSNGWSGVGYDRLPSPQFDRIQVSNDNPAPGSPIAHDAYTVRTSEIEGPNLIEPLFPAQNAGGNDGVACGLTISLVDSTASALSSDGIQTTPPNVGSFDENFFALYFGCASTSLTVLGRIDTLTLHDFGPDTDGDGLYDEWELMGYPPGDHGSPDFVDLRAMGADPLHKDLFIEVDCHPSVCPTRQVIDAIVDYFASVPDHFVENEDRRDGVAVHIDAGPDYTMKLDSSGNPVTWGTGGPNGENLSRSDRADIPLFLGDPTQEGRIFDNSVDADAFNSRIYLDFFNVAESKFDRNRRRIFRYALFVSKYHSAAQNEECRYPVRTSSSGVAIPNSQFFVVAMNAKDDSPPFWPVLEPGAQVGTFLHELGHTLGLGHGGSDNFNYKPHYFSVMNYSFQFDGMPARPLAPSIGVVQYGYSVLPAWPPLIENELDELVGIPNPELKLNYSKTYYRCPLTFECPDESWADPEHKYHCEVDFDDEAIDWNCDDFLESFVSNANINRDVELSRTEPGECVQAQTVNIQAPVDWERISFGATGTGQAGVSAEYVAAGPEMETDDTAARVVDDLAVYLWADRAVPVSGTVSVAINVRNDGRNADTYRFAAVAYDGEVDADAAPASLTLAPGEVGSVEVTITKTVPDTVGSDAVLVSATSDADASVVGYHEIEAVFAALMAPVADAGTDVTANEGDTVLLDGSMSDDPDGSIAAYRWAQSSGTAVALSSPDSATTSFVAPQVTSDTILSFDLTVTDDSGLASTDNVSVTILDLQAPPPPQTRNPGGGSGAAGWALLLAAWLWLFAKTACRVRLQNHAPPGTGRY